jgi:photosystem II stability/assembly factor-like uncharacterized protein
MPMQRVSPLVRYRWRSAWLRCGGPARRLGVEPRAPTRWARSSFANGIVVLTTCVAGCLLPLLTSGEVAAGSGSRSHWVAESSFGAGAGINDVTFVDGEDGWAAGDGGALYASRDGGQSWNVVISGTADDLKHFSLADAEHGYVAGGSTVLRMTDGATWQRVTSSSLPSGIEDLAEPTAATLVAVTQPTGGTGGIYRSVDGGNGWQQIFLPMSGVGFDRVVFAGAGSGWASGTAGLFHTTDGGQSWTPVDLHLRAYLVLGFLSPSFGYVGGVIETGAGTWAATIERTDDHGATWSTSTTHAEAAVDTVWVHALAFAPDRQQGLAAIGSALYETQDGGATWQRQSVPKGDGGAITVVGYRGTAPFAVANGEFLHDDTVPGASTPTGGGTATPAVDTPIATPSPSGLVAFPTTSASGSMPFATDSPVPFRVDGVLPASAVAGSGARLTVHGEGLEALATVTIGRIDITAVRDDGGGRISFALPGTLPAGVYDVAVTEPDGRSGVLRHALTVMARLVLGVRLLHPRVQLGATAVVLVQTMPAARVSTSVAGVQGRELAHIGITQQRGARGDWRVLIAIGPSAPIGPARIVVVARWGGQTARVALTLQVVAPVRLP